MAKSLQHSVRAKNELSFLAEKAKENGRLTPASFEFSALAEKLPENLMLDTEVAEKGFAISLLHRLSDEQLEELNQAIALQKSEYVFLYFYIHHEGKHEASVELKDFEGFDFSKVLETKFNGKTAPHLSHSYLDPIHYVSVTFDVA